MTMSMPWAAAVGLRAFDSGRGPSVVSGVANRMLASGYRIMPRAAMVRLARRKCALRIHHHPERQRQDGGGQQPKTPSPGELHRPYPAREITSSARGSRHAHVSSPPMAPVTTHASTKADSVA
jgi:hypothetical protein